MTNEELDAMKYKICCPMCDNYKCVRGTEKCEAELWKKRRMKQMTNELSVKDAIELLKEKRMEINYQVNGTTQFSEALDMAIQALEQTRWVPVGERLPEEQIAIGEYIFSKDVLGTEGYTIRRAYYNYTTKEWFDGNEETEWTEITHWMPIPEKPSKAESEGKE